MDMKVFYTTVAAALTSAFIIWLVKTLVSKVKEASNYKKRLMGFAFCVLALIADVSFTCLIKGGTLYLIFMIACSIHVAFSLFRMYKTVLDCFYISLDDFDYEVGDQTAEKN